MNEYELGDFVKQSQLPSAPPALQVLTPPGWYDYQLLDSGNGRKLERYGPYQFIRPEHRAIWRPALPESVWQAAHAVFQPTGGEQGGRWKFNQPVPRAWDMQYNGLKFEVRAANARHMDVFPEQASHWNWLSEKIRQAGRPVRVLNLFAYTGLATVAAAAAGAEVTHVDAAKRAVRQASENLRLSGLEERPVRWIVEDVFKYVRREIRRVSKYEAILLDPPKFGRGPDGQVWEFYEGLPDLLADCRALLSDRPLFVILTAYAIEASALSLHFALQESLKGLNGAFEAGELALEESSAGRLLSTALFARWSAS